MKQDKLHEGFMDFFKNRNEITEKAKEFIAKYSEVFAKKLDIPKDNAISVLNANIKYIKAGLIKSFDAENIIDYIINKINTKQREEQAEKDRYEQLDSMRYGTTYESVSNQKMTLQNAINLINEHNFILKENSFGTLDEYIAKLNDLWDSENANSDEYKTMDEILKDKWYNDLVADLYDSETEPSEAIIEIQNALAEDDALDTQIDDLDDEEIMADDEYYDIESDDYYDADGEHYPADDNDIALADDYYSDPRGDYSSDDIHEALEVLRQHGFEPMLTEAHEWDDMAPEWFEEMRRLRSRFADAKSRNKFTSDRVTTSYINQFATVYPYVERESGKQWIQRAVAYINQKRSELNLDPIEIEQVEQRVAPPAPNVDADIAREREQRAREQRNTTRQVAIDAGVFAVNIDVTNDDNAKQEIIETANTLRELIVSTYSANAENYGGVSILTKFVDVQFADNGNTIIIIFIIPRSDVEAFYNNHAKPSLYNAYTFARISAIEHRTVNFDYDNDDAELIETIPDTQTADTNEPGPEDTAEELQQEIENGEVEVETHNDSDEESNEEPTEPEPEVSPEEQERNNRRTERNRRIRRQYTQWVVTYKTVNDDTEIVTVTADTADEAKRLVNLGEDGDYWDAAPNGVISVSPA